MKIQPLIDLPEAGLIMADATFLSGGPYPAALNRGPSDDGNELMLHALHGLQSWCGLAPATLRPLEVFWDMAEENSCVECLRQLILAGVFPLPPAMALDQRAELLDRWMRTPEHSRAQFR